MAEASGEPDNPSEEAASPTRPASGGTAVVAAPGPESGGDAGTDEPTEDAGGDATAADAAARSAGRPAGDVLAPGDRRRLRRAWAGGAAPVICAFTWLLMGGSWAPLQRQYFDDFFDAQARAFLDGRWDVPPEVVSFEGFEVDGRTYIYFGPWPALLRIPVLLVTDRFDGRLTTLSMVLALVVLAVGAHHLNLAVRQAVRGPRPVSRREAVATAALAVAALSGPPLWLGSGATVHHEAILWGLAFAVAAMAAVLRWAARPSPARLAVATALAAGAVASRSTLGLGAVAGLALIGVVAGLRRRSAPAEAGRAGGDLGTVPLRWVVVACGLLFVVAVVPNLARFGTLFSPPLDRQVGSSLFEDRREFLEANGSFFGLQFLPTTALTYLRPDGAELRSTFPWIDFPRAGPSVVGDVTFDELGWTSSIPAMMPAMVVLAVPGAVWIVRSVRRRRPAFWLAPVAVAVGALVGAGGALVFGYISNRYLNDVTPVALLLGLVGAHALAGRVAAWRPAARRAAAAGLGLLVVAGLWVSLGLGLVHQRERGPVVPQDWRAELFRWRADLPGGRPTVVHTAASAPATLPDAGDGTVAVVGECEGLYVRVGSEWFGVSRGPGVGVYDVRVDLDALDDLDRGERAPLLAFEDEGDHAIVALTRLTDGRVRVDVDAVGPASWTEGYPADLDGDVTIRVPIDTRAEELFVLAGRTVLNQGGMAGPGAQATVGEVPPGVERQGVRAAYPGDIELVPYDADLCRDVTARG